MTTPRESLANSSPGAQTLGAGQSFGSSPSNSPGSGPPQRNDSGPPQQVVDKAQTEQGRDELRAAGVTDEQISLLRDMPSSDELPARGPTEEASALPQNRDATGSSADATNTSDDASKPSLSKASQEDLPSELARFTDERGTRLSEALGAGVQPEVLGKAGFTGKQISDAAGELERNRFEERRRNEAIGQFVAARDRAKAADKSSESVNPEMSAEEIQAGQAQRSVALFNERVAERADKQEAQDLKESIAFDRSHIKLATGEYVAKTTYNDLSENEQDLLRREGVAKFNERPGQSVPTSAPPTLLKTAKEFGLDLVPVYGTIRQARRLEENWEQLSTLGKVRDSAFVGLSAVGDATLVGGLVVKGIGAGAKIARAGTLVLNSGEEAGQLARVTEQAGKVKVAVQREIVADTAAKHLDNVHTFGKSIAAKGKASVVFGPSEESVKAIRPVQETISRAQPSAKVENVLEVRKAMSESEAADLVSALRQEKITSVKIREVFGQGGTVGKSAAEEIQLAKEAGSFKGAAKGLKDDAAQGKLPDDDGPDTTSLRARLKDAGIKTSLERELPGVPVVKATAKQPMAKRIRLEPEGPASGRGGVATRAGSPLNYSSVSSGRTYAEQLRLARGAPLQDFSQKRGPQEVSSKVQAAPRPFTQPGKRPSVLPAPGTGPRSVPGGITQPRTGAEPGIQPGIVTRQKPGEAVQQKTEQSTGTGSKTDTGRSEETRTDVPTTPKAPPGVETKITTRTPPPQPPPKLPPPLLPPDKRPRKQLSDEGRYPAVVEYEQGFTVVNADLRTGERKYRQKTAGEKKTPNSPLDTLKVVEYSPRRPRYRLSFSQGAVKVGVGSSSINFEGKPRAALKRRGLRGRM